MATVKKMLVEDWIKVTPNPIQRDTEKHAAKAKHLLTPHPTHSVVHAAELPNGKLIKLDGHTRALIWKRKDVVPPVQVTAARTCFGRCHRCIHRIISQVWSQNYPVLAGCLCQHGQQTRWPDGRYPGLLRTYSWPSRLLWWFSPRRHGGAVFDGRRKVAKGRNAILDPEAT